MVVQQHVLNWLYSVLTSEYLDVNRTYNDVAQTLSQYPSLLPRTDVHTSDNGASALLVHLAGTIPVVFRGATYRFPISLWVPHKYPCEPPIAYVTPTENMMVRPGQHVDPQGRIYHPYLVGWAEFWHKSSILDFLAILRDVFAKEPPVVARPQTRPISAQSTATPPPPQDVATTTALSQSPHARDGRIPPPPPPKDHASGSGSGNGNGSDGPQVVPGQAINSNGPRLPPLPPGVQRPQSQYDQPPPSNRLSRYDTALPLPPQSGPPPQGHMQGPPQTPLTYQQQRIPPGPPQYSVQAQPPLPPQPQRLQPQPGYQQEAHRVPLVVSPLTPSYQEGHPPPQRTPYAGPPPNWQPQPSPSTLQQQPPAQPKAKPPPPPDIMDEPLTLALPSPSNLAAPPIPPNPEKDALLHQLASALYARRQLARQQNESSLAGLTAQRNAMLGALQNLQADSSALAPTAAMLASNTTVLQQSLQEADGVIANSRKQPVPAIDELLVAPTVVGNQLYDVVAEERALGDAIFVLGRAVERGRITPQVFAKTTRSLAREQYLKKALARKIGRGMGLQAF